MTATPDLTAQMDQVGATLRSCAAVMGEYRKGLMDSGVPDEVADLIVRDYASRLHITIMPGPNLLQGLLGGAGDK